MRIPYDEFTTQQAQQVAQRDNQGPTGVKYVRYFSLKNDGDEAIVRFMYESPEQFDILDVHGVNNGKFDIKYSCIRDPREPIDNCPLCKAGIRVQRKFYIKLIQYFNENGNVKAEARIWERPTSYVSTLKSFMDEYSPLSDYIFKIKRVGKAGDTNTQYTIIPVNPAVYTSAIYKKDTQLFEGYEVLGSTVQDKGFEELAGLAVGKSATPTTTSTGWMDSTQPSTRVQASMNTQPAGVDSTPTRHYTPKPVTDDVPWNTSQNNQFTPRRY